MKKDNNSLKNFFNYDLNIKTDFFWSLSQKNAKILVS